ncbi:hypothetical protein DMH25_34490 [Streptomyces sp. WAC 01325]|uniref:hypothetical protein n=1 Tax=Streptomyces sp. WAC 01325 TaxID=2203202 RepID=UPI000F87BCA1|nr:hypothetical protein [Streptomyces sp. WAC 01325]RSM94046.1 hypothetical protein DMH25_34490 [Streptomyces sp. WAC 01325]
MTECIDNPAERLHGLLVEFCRVGKELGPNISNWAAWAKAMDYEGSSLSAGSAEFFHRLAEAMELPRKVREAVGIAVPDPVHREYLLGPLASVEAALQSSSNASHPISQVWQHFCNGGDTASSAAIYSLLGSANDLRRAQVEIGLTEADGQSLTAMINDLVEAVLASELDEADKHFLLTRLNEILVAVQQARLRGRYPVEAAVDAAQGALLRRPNLLQRMRDVQFLDRIVVFFTKVNAVLTLAGQTEQLTQDTVRAIERGLGS